MLNISRIKERITPVCQKYGVKAVYLFGSYARGEANEKSDVDLRVDLPPSLTGFRFFGFYADLEAALGKKLDLLTTRQLSKDFLGYIKDDEVMLYAN